MSPGRGREEELWSAGGQRLGQWSPAPWAGEPLPVAASAPGGGRPKLGWVPTAGAVAARINIP